MSNRPVHFEVACNNPQAVMDFFSSVFGWKFQSYGDSYWLATTGAEGTPGIDGAVMAKRDPQQPPVTNSILVDDIQAMAKAVEAAGGKIVVPVMPVPTMGWLAYFIDPDGNIHGLWQMDANAK